jgi:hypothetical protein
LARKAEGKLAAAKLSAMRWFRAGQFCSENHPILRIDGTTHKEEVIIVEVVPAPYQHGRGVDRGSEACRGTGVQSDGPQLLHDSLGANLKKLLRGAGGSDSVRLVRRGLNSSYVAFTYAHTSAIGGSSEWPDLRRSPRSMMNFRPSSHRNREASSAPATISVTSSVVTGAWTMPARNSSIDS